MIQGEINVLLLLLLLRGVVVDPHVLPHMLINTSACGWASASSGEIFDLIPSVEKNKMLWVGACCLPSFFFFPFTPSLCGPHADEIVLCLVKAPNYPESYDDITSLPST